MAVTAYMYNEGKAALMTADLDLENDTIKVRLHTSSYTPNVDDAYGDLDNEASGAGYTTGGATLANLTVTQDDANDRAEFDADDTTWPSASITARYAVVVDTTASNRLIGYVDFGEDIISSGGTFQITWDAEGIVQVT